MTLVLNIILIISGVLLASSIMLMSPKGWLGVSIGGMGTSNNEYWSKKSAEHRIKNLAYISGAIFLIVVVLYPYL